MKMNTSALSRHPSAQCCFASKIRATKCATRPLRSNKRTNNMFEVGFYNRSLDRMKIRSHVLNVRCKSASTDDIIDVEGTTIDDRIPVTVITGFLGSGKTTLLNNILTADHGHRIAVIENEFGEIDIDSDLVALREDLDPENEQILMLNNGCLCCTVRDDLVQMLNKLQQRKNTFDRIIIETTGLANPAPIIQTFFLEPSVADHMKLDGVVTLVDAKHIEFHLDGEKPDNIVNEAIEQVAFADRIILNKTDLVAPADIARVEKRLKTINALAEVQHAQRATVSVDYVLGIGGFDLEKVDDDITAMSKRKEEKESEHHDHHECGPGCTHHSHGEESHSHGHSHGEESHSHDHSHGHSHTHDDSVTSTSLTIDGDLDLDKVNYWLGGLLEVKSNDIYRMKGVLAIDGFDRRFVFQGVHMLFEGMPDRQWKEGEKRRSKMVFIGKDLDDRVLREGFEECIVTAKKKKSVKSGKGGKGFS